MSREDAARAAAKGGSCVASPSSASRVSIGVLAFARGAASRASARVAALQVGLRAHGFDPGPVDGVARAEDDAARSSAFQRKQG